MVRYAIGLLWAGALMAQGPVFIPAGGGKPGAPVNSVQYDCAGAFCGDARFVFDAAGYPADLNSVDDGSPGFCSIRGAGVTSADCANTFANFAGIDLLNDYAGFNFYAGASIATKRRYAQISYNSQSSRLGFMQLWGEVDLSNFNAPVAVGANGSQLTAYTAAVVPLSVVAFPDGGQIANLFQALAPDDATVLDAFGPTGQLLLNANIVNPFVNAKNTQAATAPGAGFCDLRWIAGTGAGTGKLVAACGTSATEVTIVDNVGVAF